MQEKLGAIFAVSGLIVILSMFMNIASNVQCHSTIDNDVLVISAFNG